MKFNVHAILRLGIAALLLVSSWLHADDCLSGIVEIGNLNCTACHTSSEQQKEWIQTKLAPSLNDIGNRVSAEWLQRYLVSPQNEHPGTTMPDLLHGDTSKAEALTQFLISKGECNFRRVVPDRAAVARGESIYHRVGCVACHAPQNGSAVPIDSVPLPKLDKKWAYMGLKNFLLDPLSVRPSGRMPSMNLTEREAADVAHYLLKETHLPASAEVAFYSERIRSLESLDSANSVQTAPVSGFNLDGIMREKVNAIRISTWLDVKVSGEYTFFLKATGASRLSIAGRWSLGEESWEKESVDEKYDMDLKPGRYELKLDFVRRGKNKPALLVEWQGPGIVRQTIPEALMSSEREPSSDLTVEVPTFIPDTRKIKQGRLLYQSLNCAACHEGKSSNNSLPSLSDLDTTRGCLAAAPAAPTITSIANGVSFGIDINFTAGNSFGIPIANYQYSLNDGLNWTAISPPDNLTPITITSVTDGANYAIRLQAVNIYGGVSQGSNSIDFTFIPNNTLATQAGPSITTDDGRFIFVG